jgi:hypothetical protein
MLKQFLIIKSTLLPKQAGALEAANMAKYGKLVSLSTQNFIDCTG